MGSPPEVWRAERQGVVAAETALPPVGLTRDAVPCGSVAAAYVILDPAWLGTLVGARLDALHLTPETGLVALTMGRSSEVLHLVAGVGPRVVGLGLAVRAPVFHVGKRHPLVVAARAHLLGRIVRTVGYDDDGALWLSLCGDDGLAARLRLWPVSMGEVRLLDATGVLIQVWHGERVRLPRVCEPEGEAEAVGAELLRTSDALAAELRRATLLKALRALGKKLARLREHVEADLARLDHVPTLQRTGRLLLAQGARIPRGATRAVLEDWEEGGTLVVTLDPSLPAKQQAERFFQQARRVQRGEVQMRTRLDRVLRTYDAVKALEVEVGATEEITVDALRRWDEAARGLGLREGTATAKQGPVAAAPRVPYIEYFGWRGRRIWVGKGATDNDTLTLKVARPGDLWMHARGVVGAHVVVPLERGAQCSQELLLDAATLAAYHSEARGSDFVEVTWTERRYVRKPRKSPPGRVVLDREKVLALRPDAARLTRLLATRREAHTILPTA